MARKLILTSTSEGIFCSTYTTATNWPEPPAFITCTCHATDARRSTLLLGRLVRQFRNVNRERFQRHLRQRTRFALHGRNQRLRFRGCEALCRQIKAGLL